MSIPTSCSSTDVAWFSSQCSVYHNTCGVVAIFVAVERVKEGGRKGGEEGRHRYTNLAVTAANAEESTQAAATGGEQVEKELSRRVSWCGRVDGRQETFEISLDSPRNRAPR